MPVDRAVIPVAGLGTRLLPTTKAIPKEMLPAGRLPIIHLVVEELIQAGIRRILFISSRSKVAIENHFDDYSALLMHLELDGRDVGEVGRFDYRQRGIEFFFTRRKSLSGRPSLWAPATPSTPPRASCPALPSSSPTATASSPPTAETTC